MRKQFPGVVLAALAGMFVASPPAHAQSQAFTNQAVNLYAGPAADFPVVAQIPAGSAVTVWGCVTGFSWCDIGFPGLRGWVYGTFISYPWQGQRVPVMSYGPQLGLPIVPFALGTYWGQHYRDRPWYSNQYRWARHPSPRPVPPPPVRPPSGARPPYHGGGHRPPNHAGPGNRPPGAGGGNNNARPPGPGNARPPGPGGGPPGQGGGRPPGGGNNRPQGGGGGPGGGGRPPPGG
ncbi:SH3 domain-containing protein [Paraburkholderia sp. J76]|uniref:SH3 domain-containing protein n=1 Tax=Paraburkholderia sp. J76 TaxID=2805439 RepID=UPI002ABE1569|nr:SH3 domain-containing protein [Paraburkholderia sp. J76]